MVEFFELKPYRQKWLTPELLHSAPKAEIVYIDGNQWAQLEHPKGGPLTCVQNRTGKNAVEVVKNDGRWSWKIDSGDIVPSLRGLVPGQNAFDLSPLTYDAADEIELLRTAVKNLVGALDEMTKEYKDLDLPYGSSAYQNAITVLNLYGRTPVTKLVKGK